MARRDAGFTLVEMLVSLALLAMAAAMMATGFAAGRNLWARQETGAVLGERVEAAQTLIRARIEGLRPVTRFEGQAPLADITGDGESLTFLSLPPDAQRPGPVRRWRLGLNPRGELTLASSPRVGDSGVGDDAVEQVLLDKVEGVEIRYFGPDETGGTAQWRSDWTRRTTAPQLVRVRVSLAPGDRRVWPDLIARPAAVVDSLCTIDPETNSCRGRL